MDAAVSVLSKDRQTFWQEFLGALAILRNKLSHSKPIPSLTEQERLRKAGLGAIIAPNGELRLNAPLIPSVIRNLIDFFDEIDRAHPLR